MPNQPCSSDAPLCLEITRGRTEHPTRPVRGARFLVGSGSWCDLCLGGSIPPLHSVVSVKDNEVWIERIAQSPELLVNGRAAVSCEIRHGDHLTIGSFSMTLHDNREQQIAENLMAKVDVAALMAEDEAHQEGVDEELSQLTATELADRLERDETLVAEFEARREQGAAALLSEIQRRIREDAQNSDQHHPLAALGELKNAIGSLDQLADRLEDHADSMPVDEYESAASSLLDFQQQMLGRLDGVLERVARLKSDSQRQQDVA